MKEREKEFKIYAWRFLDTDSAATYGTGVFEEVTEDAAVVDDIGKEVDVRAELDEGNISNENYFNDFF